MTARFHMWGCRGGRNTCGSRVGNATSCCSIAVGRELFVFDAGTGLVALSEEIVEGGRLAAIARAHVLVTHAHMDHWEGLKDARWLWRRDNGLDVIVLAPKEALDTIRRVHEPPAFVQLEVLAAGTLASLSFVEIAAAQTIALPGATLETVALHHYSVVAPNKRYLDTVGCKLSLDGGPAIAYVCDHEPTPATRAMEDGLLSSCQLAIVDSNYSRVAEHAFGHGSIEYAAELARRHPNVRIVAAHHGPYQSDRAIEEAYERYGAGCPNLVIAVEHREERWDEASRSFVPVLGGSPV
jgi:phosphoribosyl 1,2-cyclic phosphodiesterase